MRVLTAVVAVLCGLVSGDLEFEQYSSSDAVCNDGSRAGMYFARASDPASSDVWVVQMQGGGWCWDNATCAKRPASLTSSKAWPPSMAVEPGSILDATGTDFAKGNRVYQRYCTSDGYIGNASASPATAGLHFRGHTVVKSLLEALVSKGMGVSGNATLIFSGCSAGGRGVMHNTNFAGEFARNNGVRTFVALIDSGLYIDIMPMTPTHTALRDQAKGVMTYSQAAIDPHCAGTYEGDEWKCLIGQYAVPTLRQPTLLHAFQDDAYQLAIVDFKIPYPASVVRLSKTLSTYAAGFRNKTREVLFDTLKTQGRVVPRVAVHSATCYHHCNTEASSFSTGYTVNGISLKNVLQNFVFGTDGQTVAIDNCTGTFACGAGC